MQNALQRILRITSQPAVIIVYLLVLCLAAYGPFLPSLGFYWDDFPISWIATTMGAEGLARYFSTNRPVWGLLYTFTTPILGSDPLRWQVFALLLRWLSGVALWLLLRVTWPKQARLAAWAAALFVVYPGFSQQFISFVYSHFFIVLITFLLSLTVMVVAVRRPNPAGGVLTIMSLVTSLFQLLAMEYFFVLDLLRPVLIWIALRERVPDARQRIQRAALLWLPYLAVLVGVIIWRTFFFGFHTYQPTLASQLRAQPLETLPVLLGTMLKDISLTGVLAWVQAFDVPGPENRLFQPLRYWLVVGATGLFSALFLLLYQPAQMLYRDPESLAWKPSARKLLEPLALALLALVLAGGPFWLTNLQIGLTFSTDRFTLPFMLGASLGLAALVGLLPVPHAARAVLLALVLAFSAGAHFKNGAAYRQDWNTQRSLFWQMTWRAPALQPGTLLVANEMPIPHYSDNSLSAPLNWIYDPQNEPPVMKYLLFYPGVRKEAWLVEPKRGVPIERDYLAATFEGSTDQVLVVFFDPPGCLRVLDPETDEANWMVPGPLRNLLRISNRETILPEPGPGASAARPPAHLYGAEPRPNWCYYFQKADLARQQGDWERVAQLGDEAFASGDYPNDPAERLPFIEGYAHVGNWQRALELSRETRQISEVMAPVLCRLWERIERETGDRDGKQEAVEGIRSELGCGR